MRSPELFTSRHLECCQCRYWHSTEARSASAEAPVHYETVLTAHQGRSRDGSPDGQRFLFIKDSPG